MTQKIVCGKEFAGELSMKLIHGELKGLETAIFAANWIKNIKSKRKTNHKINFNDFSDFIHKQFDLPHIGIKVLGYFPYETASISNVLPGIPSNMFLDLKHDFHVNGIYDNKVVIICEPLERFDTDDIAIFLKDGKVRIGHHSSVTGYGGKQLKLKC